MKLNQVSREFYGKAKCKEGTRRPAEVDWIVIHDTEGDSARSGAITLTTRTNGSAHKCLDGKVCYEIDAWTTILCGTGGFNVRTYHIEQPGRASYTRREWLQRKAQLRRLAYHVAYDLVRHKLPNRYGLADDIRARKRGYTTHLQVTESGLGTTTHTDPGRAFPFEGKRGERAWISYFWLRFRLLGLPRVRIV